MQTHMNITTKRTKSGLPYLRLCFHTMEGIDWRTIRGEGKSLEEMQAEAERYAMQHYPGGIQFRLMLPLGDNGHADL